MNSLQVALAIAGGVILGGVVAWNAWSARRHMPRPPEPEPARAEPTLDNLRLPEPPPEGAEAEADYNTVDALLAPLSEKRPNLDPLIDVIAPIGLDGQVSGDAMLAALPSTRRVGSKPFAVEGFNELAGEWENPMPGHRYHQVQAGVQLANRGGALNAIEFSEFVVKTRAFADALGGTPDIPEMNEAVAHARELDDFASAHDAQLAVHLRARGAAWSAGYVQQQAVRQGFVHGVMPGRMVLPGMTPGAPVLALAFDTQAALSEDPEQSAIYELTISLDVPHVPREERPLERLYQLAHALAEIMDGDIIDDRGQRLSDHAMASIHDALERLYDALDARELSAGSPQARRLFS